MLALLIAALLGTMLLAFLHTATEGGD